CRARECSQVDRYTIVPTDRMSGGSYRVTVGIDSESIGPANGITLDIDCVCLAARIKKTTWKWVGLDQGGQSTRGVVLQSPHHGVRLSMKIANASDGTARVV